MWLWVKVLIYFSVRQWCVSFLLCVLWRKQLSKNDTAMWHKDHLYPHSWGYVLLSYPIMADQRWELSRPLQTDMNLKVAIWPKMNINRSHLMATQPAPCLSNTFSLPLTYLGLCHCLCLLPAVKFWTSWAPGTVCPDIKDSGGLMLAAP